MNSTFIHRIAPLRLILLGLSRDYSTVVEYFPELPHNYYITDKEEYQKYEIGVGTLV